MKTTVEIPDPLFRAARKHCAEHGISFRQLIEAGLRQAIDRKQPASSFRMKPFGFRGEAQLEQDWAADPRDDLSRSWRIQRGGWTIEVIAVDTNILVYAHRQESPWHAAAAACLISLAEGGMPWAIPWPCVHEFFSVVTHPRIFRPPTPARLALTDLDAWFESPSLRLIGENEAYWPRIRHLLEKGSVAGPMVHDARIAAICQSHGVEALFSADRDFSRFPGLAVRNPLVSG